MADNTIANAIKFLKGEEKSLPAAKTEGQVYFAYKNVGTAEKPSYTGAIYIDTPIGGTQNRIKMTANADIADKAFNDSAGLNIRDTYLSSLGYTDDGKQTILIKGSGNNQTRIALPIASTTKSGIVTTDAQSFGGTKTFTTINSTNLTITGTSGFNYSGIETATKSKARPVWFADNSGNGKPVINTNFTYNPATQTLNVANLSGTADKANKDNAGNDIRSTYISNITVNNDIMTITKGSGATSTLSIKDKLYSGDKITTKDDLDNFIETNVFKFGHIGPIEGYNGLEKNSGIILSASWKSYTNYGHQIFIDDNGYALRHRYRNDGNWSDWASILDSTNYNSYAPTKAGGGAYGTWDINILGNAASANKLNTNAGSATFPVYFSNGVPVACSTNLAVSITGNAASATKLTSNAGSIIQPIYFSGGKPVACAYTLSKSVPADAKFTDTWRPLGTTGDTACAGNDSRLSNARPASDVYAWAKASTKPTYTKAEIGLGNVDNTADSQKSVKYATTSGSATTATKLQTYKQGSTTETYGTQYPLYAQWEDSSNLRLKVDNYTVKVNYADKAGSASSATNAATATKLQTARTISLTGSVTGSGTFDGSGNLSVTTSTNHSHSQYLPLAGGTMNGTSFITWADSGNWKNNNNNVTFPVIRGGLRWYGQSDSVKLFSQETARDNLELVLQFEDDNSNGLSIRNSTDTQTARIDANGNIAAASLRVGNGSGSTINFCTNGSTANPGAKIVAYNDRIEFVFA